MTGRGKGGRYGCLPVTQLGITTVVAACLTVFSIFVARVLDDGRLKKYMNKLHFCFLQEHKGRFNTHLKLLDYANVDLSQHHLWENNANTSQIQVFTRGTRLIGRLRDDYETSPAMFAWGDREEAGDVGSFRGQRGVEGNSCIFFPSQAHVHVHSTSPSLPHSRSCSTPAESNPHRAAFSAPPVFDCCAKEKKKSMKYFFPPK